MGRPSEYTVYVLRDECGDIRYVGVTKSANDRYARHLREAKARKTHRHCWIMSMIDRGMKPAMEVVETTLDWDEAERRWIAKCKAEGCDLVNGNEGGKSLHQTRHKSEQYPNIKRFYRVLESFIRSKYLKPETIEQARRNKDMYCQIVTKHRKAGTLAWLDARLAGRCANY